MVAADGDEVKASAIVRNSGERTGAATPLVFLSGPAPANIPLRLAGWSRIELQPGEARRVTVSIDPRLFARFDERARRWSIAGGDYRITAGFDVDHRTEAATVRLAPASLPP